MDVSSTTGSTIAAMMAKVQTSQKIDSAVAHLAKQVSEQQGQQTVQLVQASAQPAAGSGNVGTTVDVMA